MFQKQEIYSTQLPALLRYEDKNSMRHSIEARLPFLDYRMLQLSLSIPFGIRSKMVGLSLSCGNLLTPYCQNQSFGEKIKKALKLLPMNG